MMLTVPCGSFIPNEIIYENFALFKYKYSDNLSFRQLEVASYQI